ncbi:addiction module component [Brasilonema sp. UFV-L1]|nr:addiction module component [Brasilonema sp. UFV-L1]
MTETAEKLKLELSQLSAQERADIAHFLIQSLDENIANENVDNDVEAAWDTELTKRLEDIHRGTAIGEPSNQVFSELREKYS